MFIIIFAIHNRIAIFSIIKNLNAMKLRTLLSLGAFLSILILNPLVVTPQVSEGGLPLSFSSPGLFAGDPDTRFLAVPDMNKVNREDEDNARSPFPAPERMGVSVPVNLDIHSSGDWETLADGTRVWRLRLVASGALALGVYFDDFALPAGARLFLYGADHSQLIGAFTSANNHESGLFATQFIQGGEVTLEYEEPAGTTEKVRMSISEVAYAYRYIYFDDNGGIRDPSWPCMINFACPEGIGWEDQSRGIARLSIKIGWSYYWCSGSLINNTSNNRVPYLLTAEHCGEGATASDMNQWVFYFNYQASACTGNYGPSNNTVTGCSKKAYDPLASYDGADFLLVQLNTTPPAGYNVYYNGWNRTNVPGNSGVGIHHPNGDIKKISTFSNPMISSTWWNGTPSHWRITWSPTVTGLSIMQGGSSGSPIFDQDKLIMGDLSGGYSSNACSNPSPAWYGKIWYAWDQNGTTPATRLKDWLDPTNTGVLKQPGISSQILPPVVDFTADTTHLSQGEAVQFTDLTTGNPATSWTWTFPGGTPGASNMQHPTVYYNTAGTFSVTLTVVNPDGTDTEVKNDYITVDPVLAPVADFSATAQVITEGESVTFTDLSTNNPDTWSWIFEGGTPDTSSQQNPGAITYSVPGTYDVSLTAANIGGSGTELKADFITVNPGIAPTADFYADVTEIGVGDTVNFFDLSTGDPTQWLWTFEGGTPAGSSVQNPTGIVYNEEGIFNVQLRAKNTYGTNILLREDYITVGNVSIKDLNTRLNLAVYPNPSSGLINISLGGSGVWKHKGDVEIEVMNVLGEVVLNSQVESGSARFALNLAGQPEGLYVIRARLGNETVQRKISISK